MIFSDGNIDVKTAFGVDYMTHDMILEANAALDIVIKQNRVKARMKK